MAFDSYLLESMFYNPDVVLIALFLLFFLVIFSVLTRKGMLGGSRGTALIISLAISGIAVYYINNAYYWLLSFNILLGLIVVVIAFFIIWAFIKFSRRTFRR